MAYSPGPVPRDPYRPGLGILPAVVPAVEGVVSSVTSLFHIGTKAVDVEKTIAPGLQAMAAAGNLTAFGIIIARGTIKTQGFFDLYNPIITSLRTAHPDWYAQAVALTQNPPQGHALWDFPEDKNVILGFATANARMATTAPGGPTPGSNAVTSPTFSAGLTSPLAILAILGAVLVGPKLLKGR